MAKTCKEKQISFSPVWIPLKGHYHSKKGTTPRVHLWPWSTDTWVRDQMSGGHSLPLGSSACLASLRRAAANPEWADWDAGLPLGTIELLRGDGVRGLTVAVLRVAVEIMPNDGDFGSWLMPEEDRETEWDIRSNKQDTWTPTLTGWLIEDINSLTQKTLTDPNSCRTEVKKKRSKIMPKVSLSVYQHSQTHTHTHLYSKYVPKHENIINRLNTLYLCHLHV